MTKPLHLAKLEIVPLHLWEAQEFVGKHHRHNDPPVGAKFALGCAIGDRVVGVGIAGRPVARHLQDGWTIEILRCCTDGTGNACSMIYGACRRAALALGFRRVVTYSRADESGTSLRAAGFRVIADVRGRHWNCRSRPRVEKDEPQDKLRWESAL